MKTLIEEISREKRFRASIFVDVWAENPSQAELLIKDIQRDIPNSYIGGIEKI